MERGGGRKGALEEKGDAPFCTPINGRYGHIWARPTVWGKGDQASEPERTRASTTSFSLVSQLLTQISHVLVLSLTLSLIFHFSCLFPIVLFLVKLFIR